MTEFKHATIFVGYYETKIREIKVRIYLPICGDSEVQKYPVQYLLTFNASVSFICYHSPRLIIGKNF